MVSQLKSHRFNFVYHYMFWFSWDHHQAVYILNTIKLIEISVWIHIVVQHFSIIKIVNNIFNAFKTLSCFIRVVSNSLFIL
jgi:hypothetical protein